MKTKIFQNTRCLLIVATGLLLLFSIGSVGAQQIRWLRVTQLQTPVNEIGAEFEGEFTAGNTNIFSWPAQYSIDQNTLRCRGLWLGCVNFDDPVEGKIKSHKVIDVGPRVGSYATKIFPVSMKLIGKYYHPAVTVDDQLGSVLYSFDMVDEQDPNLPCDREVRTIFNTSMGLTVDKKVMAFAETNHDNYHVKDFVITNTGIYDAAGHVKSQTLDSVYIYFCDRYSFAGVSCTGYGLGWGSWNSTWGESNINHVLGEDPSASGFEMRASYTWYGPCFERTQVSYDEDWGNPAQNEDGQLASAKYAGFVALHADKSVTDRTDDPWQPRTNNFISADLTIMNKDVSQYDDATMADRWAAITDGHPKVQHDILVGDTYAKNYTDPRRQAGGGVQPEMAFGPYHLAPGDSIHIVVAEAVAGISWEKGREVGANWLQWKNKTGTPALVLPNGSTSTNQNEYKRIWVQTGVDSILQAYRNAIKNYNSGYNLPKAPPPPDQFKVTSGGDKIMLDWSSNPDAAPHFDGYVIYRSRGSVLDRNTVYEKLFECGRANVVHHFDDMTAVRGFDYYYYIQSKDDGLQNDVHSGVPLYSSLFWTITSVPATLQRPAVTAPNSSPDGDAAHWIKRQQSKGEWTRGTSYARLDIADTLGVSYICIDSVHADTTNPGRERHHVAWRPLIVKGAWDIAEGYQKGNVVSYSGDEYINISDVAAGVMLEQVRIVPNPYDIRSRIFQFGDKSQYDRIAFYGLPPICKLKIFTERGDLIWSKDHTRGTGDELWDSMTSTGQIITSGIYILYVETPAGQKVFRKFVVIR